MISTHSLVWHLIQLYLVFHILWGIRQGIKIGKQIDWQWWANDIRSGAWFKDLARDLAHGEY